MLCQDQNLWPYKIQVVQQLIDGKLVKRRDFSQWYKDKINDDTEIANKKTSRFGHRKITEH